MEVESKTKIERWWSQLVWESEREFVSPFNLEECVSRLKALDAKHSKERSSFFSIFRFYIEDLEGQKEFSSFKMHISMSKVIIKAELFGQLINKVDRTTQVKLRLGYKLGSIITLILLLPCLYIFSFLTGRTSTPDILILLAIYIFAIFVQISFGYGLKPELYHEIHKELTGDTQVANANKEYR